MYYKRARVSDVTFQMTFQMISGDLFVDDVHLYTYMYTYLLERDDWVRIVSSSVYLSISRPTYNSISEMIWFDSISWLDEEERCALSIWPPYVLWMQSPRTDKVNVLRSFQGTVVSMVTMFQRLPRAIDSVDIVVHVYAVPPRPQMHGSLLDQWYTCVISSYHIMQSS